MKQLLENDFVVEYGIRTQPIADCVVTDAEDFDLVDMPSPIVLHPVGSGSFSLHNDHGELSVIHYEHFIDQCNRPQSFYKGRKKCDYLLTHKESRHTAMLVEVTSALGNTKNLLKPILQTKEGEVLYAGGKFEKCEDQLFQSLRDLIQVARIASKLDTYEQKVCMLAYTINPYTDPELLRRKPFLRYLHIEARETADNGAIISSPKIESLGFEYRRIEHSHVFSV